MNHIRLLPPFHPLIENCRDGPLYAFSLFVPSIVAELGFSANRANLLTIPVYVWACFCTISVGFLADRYQRRGVFNL